MAALGQTFDANNVAPSAGSDVIPAGKYVAQIVNSEMRDTKSGDGRYLWMELAILDGPLANRRLFERLNLVNKNAQAVEISQSTLSAICRAVGKMTVSDSEMLHFQPMMVTVKVKPAGPDKQGVHREAQNNIGGYEAVGGSTVQMTHRPSSTTPPTSAAPASRPATSTPPWRNNKVA